MARYGTVLGDDNPMAAPRKRGWRLLAAAALLAASPLLYEGGLVVTAQWQAMLGGRAEARTPILDRISEAWDTARGEMGEDVRSYVRFKGVSPLAVVAAVGGLALFGSYFLKRD